MAEVAQQNGVKVREAVVGDAAQIASVHVGTWHSSYAGIIPNAVLSDLSIERCEAFWRDVLSAGDAIVAVAECGDQLLGFASAGPNRDSDGEGPGELMALYVVAAHQRHGIGRLLFLATHERLRARGLVPFMLWVLEGNPAIGFYEGLGGRRLGQKRVKFGDAELNEFSYLFS